MIKKIEELLGDNKSLLEYTCKGIPKETLHLPGSDLHFDLQESLMLPD